MITNDEKILRQVFSSEVVKSLQYRKLRDLEPSYDSVLRTMIQICIKHDLEHNLNKKYVKNKEVSKN